MEQQQNDNQKHVETLQRLLAQLDGLKLDSPESKARLEAALRAAVDALGGDKGGEKQQASGLDLSADPATDHLLRLSSGRLSAREEKNADAVNTLVAAVNNTARGDEKADAAKALARMVKD